MEDQSLNIRVLVPLLFFFNLSCALAISHWPDFFIDRAGDVWLIAAQLLSFMIYLFYVTRFYNGIAPLISRSHEGAQQRIILPREISVSFPRPDQQLHVQLPLDLVVK